MAKEKPTLIYENTVSGVFVNRENRFTATCLIEGKEEKVHIKNTGRLENLLVPKAKVTLQKIDNPTRNTKYDLISVYKTGLKWVNIDSLAPNALMRQFLESMNYDLLKPEYSYGESRVDFYMERDGEKYLTEVKGCTLAADVKSGIGLFPDAPTTRGIRHLKELAEASQQGYHCTIAFVIQMNGIHLVFPNDAIQPEFRKELEEAVKTGVRVVCYGCKVEADSVKITRVVDDTSRFSR